MIKKSIYRDGGSIRWTSTIDDVIEVFNNAPITKGCIGITAPDKGMGKSTAFEFLSTKRIEGICVEGDIMSVLGAFFHANLEYTGKETIVSIADGITFPGFFPWTHKVEGDKNVAYDNAFSKVLGKDWKNKIALRTMFYGMSDAVALLVIPDHRFYSVNMTTRIKAMVSDSTKTKDFRDHIAKHHKVLNWREFNSALVDVEVKLQKRQIPVLRVANFSSEIFELELNSAFFTARTLLGIS